MVGVLLAIVALLVVVFVVLPLAGLALWVVVSTAVVGLVIGALARLVVPGRQAIGVLATIAVGIAGSLIGSGIGAAIDVGGLLTFLLQVGVAAAGVAVVSRRPARVVGQSRRRSSLP